MPSPRRDSQARAAHDHLIRRIRQGHLRPGDWLDRKAIAEELGVSLQPVADAVTRLTASGLLEAVPRRGTRLRSVNLQDLRAQMLVREALECQAARLYCGPRVRRHRHELIDLAQRADGEGVEGDESRVDADSRLHEQLVALTEMAPLIEQFHHTCLIVQLQQQLLVAQEWTFRDSHVTLLDALGEADPDTAEQLLRRHVRSGKHALFERFAEPLD